MKRFTSPLVQEGYKHPAPHPQQLPHTHLCAPSTSHHKKPHSLPALQTPGIALLSHKHQALPQKPLSHLQDTLPLWIHLPAMLLSASGPPHSNYQTPALEVLQLLPQPFFMVEENSPLISLAPHIIGNLPHLLPVLVQLLLRL